MTRSRAHDACPGALRVHQAADGALVRVRLPGGMISAGQFAALARAARRFGSGSLELTSRGNVQIRGVCDPANVTTALAGAGLLPSATHERVRNIVASPLSGRIGGLADVRGWVTELDEAIQAEPALARLPGRFWFSLDDGRADVSGLGADVGVQVVDDGVALLLAGRDTGVRLSAGEVVPTLTGLAARFLVVRKTAWRVAELADIGALLPDAGQSGAPATPVTRPPVGWLPQRDGRIALGAAVPLGVLSARVAECLAGIGAPLVITPWRSVLVCDLEETAAGAALRVLGAADLVVDETSPWLRVSACTGSPGCAYSAADVRADAAAAARAADSTGHRHFVGCARACGSPPVGQVLVATGEGYRLLRDADDPCAATPGIAERHARVKP
ncbi:precorrin-3B synthase [Mycobacterium sp. SM1]|uniref:precorrin-3B synthase n=1 Tax=Mycobacterium sp. SM1 TaxID=2816243 RepID=UPI001BCEFDE3|nr:precorrin-3B synthase [Mycobacterium sp. SM1]MBS4730470.1 precorrin-3B synthase [Mycobacterium sp. SM1]